MCEDNPELTAKLKQYERLKKLDQFLENMHLEGDLRWWLRNAAKIRKLLEPFDESEKQKPALGDAAK